MTVDKGEEKILKYCEPVGFAEENEEFVETRHALSECRKHCEPVGFAEKFERRNKKKHDVESVAQETIVNCQLQNCQLFFTMLQPLVPCEELPSGQTIQEKGEQRCSLTC